MNTFKIFSLYLQFFLYEFYNIFLNIKKIFKLGVINYIKFSVLKQDIQFKNNHINHYLKENNIKWKKLKKNKTKNGKENKKIIITGFVHIPIYYMMNALFGKFLEDKFSSNVFCLLEKNDHLGYSIFKSFNFENFIFIDKGNFFDRISAFAKSIKIILSFNSIESFLKFKKDKVYLGKIVYDHYLRHTGNCTTTIANFKIFYFLTESLIIHSQLKKKINNKKFKFGVQSEHQFIPSAICFQNFLNNNIKIFSRNKGPKWITISSFKGHKDIYTPRDKIDFKIFKSIKKKYYKKISDLGSKIVKQRFLGKDNFSLKSWGIKINDNKDISLTNFKKIYNIDNNNPIVCIFGHLFVDGNYSNGWRVHKDNLTWLITTLNIIKDIKKVNWIIKPHPLEDKFKTSTSTLIEVSKYTKSFRHIKLADKRITNNFLKKNLFALVSSHGTAPLEFATFGVPSVVCGNTRYSELGFLNTARNYKEYKYLLENITNIKKLKKKDILKANIFTYLAGRLVIVDSEVIPDVLSGQSKLHNYDNNFFWKSAIKKINKFNYYSSNLRKQFFNQINKEQENILNENILQKDLSIKLNNFFK